MIDLATFVNDFAASQLFAAQLSADSPPASLTPGTALGGSVPDPISESATHPISKAAWIQRYGGQLLLDNEGFDVVECEDCDDVICHGWRVIRGGQR